MILSVFLGVLPENRGRYIQERYVMLPCYISIHKTKLFNNTVEYCVPGKCVAYSKGNIINIFNAWGCTFPGNRFTQHTYKEQKNVLTIHIILDSSCVNFFTLYYFFM